MKEKSKHITTDDLHEGFESKVNNLSSFSETLSTLPTVRSPKPEPAPVINGAKSKCTSKTTHIEVLNPLSASSALELGGKKLGKDSVQLFFRWYIFIFISLVHIRSLSC
ncbi:hypothetical protein H4582DRAFT_1922721 [Lactarius indigo]|nr:hypothetical protein H4582DRAFT_1922721 [Lactarius indigo]